MFPIVIKRALKGANGTNWPGVVILDPSAPQRAAVLAQEAWEALWSLNPVNLARRIVSKSAQRDMEIMGHECEVQAAILIYGSDEATRRQTEAASLRRGYDGLFARMTENEIAAAMAQQSPAAVRFVTRHQDRLTRFK